MMELLFVEFFQVLWLGNNMGNGDKACSVNIACRASSFVFFFLFPNICSEHLSDLKLSLEAILL